MSRFARSRSLSQAGDDSPDPTVLLHRLVTNLSRLPLLAVLLLIPFHTMLIAHVLPARLGVQSLAPAMWKEGLLLMTLCCGTVEALTHRRVRPFSSLELSVLTFVTYEVLSLPFAPSLLAGLYGRPTYSEAFVALVLSA